MIKQQINSISTNHNNRLSVQISLTGLSFLVASPKGEILHYSEKKFQAQRTPEELFLEMDDCFTSNAALEGTFEDVTLIYTTHNYTLVPSSLFEEQKASEYLKFNTKILANDYISHDEIASLQMMVVYVPFVNLNNYIFERFGTFQYFHSTTLLLQNLIHIEKHAQDTKVYLHIAQHQFECIVIDKGGLQLCNSFPFNSPEDFIYYVLFVLEQLDLNPEMVETIVLGEISKESELYQILYTYVRNVSFLNAEFAIIDTEMSHERYLLKSLL